MLSMGLTDKISRRALKNCDMNIERAIDWAFSHMDDPDSDEEMKGGQEDDPNKDDIYLCKKPPVYELQSFITHLGASVHAGHYVCHVFKGGKWVYFNDAKVALTDDPPIGKGYMYFFTKP